MNGDSFQRYTARVDPQGQMSEPELLAAVAAAQRADALHGRIGGLESWSRTTDRTARTAPGHSNSPASLDYHLARVDPGGVMSEADRLKAAKDAHRAHMLRLAERSAQARRIRASLRTP